MSKNTRYWLWVQRALGEGYQIGRIIDAFGSVERFYHSNILEWRINLQLTEKQITKLEEAKVEDVEEIIYTCQQNNWQIIDYDDDAYPQRLKQIINPPAVLFVDGTLPDVDDSVLIGVVGTRKASDYAIKVAHLMSRGISEAGAIVVSGGALGVDTAAHKGAIISKGKTIAVLGSGLGNNYLASNKQLRDVIKQNGALVTEYPPFTPASKKTFPLRNRIISGLSLGVLVVEAGVKSGSLITANYAIEQNRDVYAVPASVLSPAFAGTNKLIDDGAMVATKPEHIIAGYAMSYPSIDMSKIRSLEELMSDEADNSANVEQKEDKYSFERLDETRESRSKNQERYSKLSKELKQIVDCLDDKFEHIDVIIEKTGLPSFKVMAALTQLEIMGLIESTSGKRYKLS